VQGLPVRGQRTKTNARTRKGKAKTVAGKVRVCITHVALMNNYTPAVSTAG
jgi:hypothetical protein